MRTEREERGSDLGNNADGPCTKRGENTGSGEGGGEDTCYISSVLCCSECTWDIQTDRSVSQKLEGEKPGLEKETDVRTKGGKT